MISELSAEEFIRLFNKPEEPVEVKDCTIIGEVLFFENNFKCKYAKIDNVIFKKDVHFRNSNLGIGISFTNSTFDKSLCFFDSDAAGHARSFSWESTSLIIDNCKISEFEIEGINNFERGLNIKESSLDKISVSQLVTTKGGIYIENSTIAKKFDLDSINLNGSGQLRIHNSKIYSKVRYNYLVVDGITFTGNEFARDLHIWSGISKTGIVFNDNIFKDDVFIKGVESVGSLTISGDDFKKSLQIDFEDKTNDVLKTISSIYILSGSFGISFILNGSNQQIDNLLIAASQNLTGTVQFNSCIFKKVKIQGDNHKGNFVFNLCQFQRILFEFFINFGNLILSSSRAVSAPGSELIIHSSNLGKAQFFNFSLDSFTIINILSSQLSEIITSGVTWFTDEKLLKTLPENSVKNRRKRDIYRQLRQALEKQGDKIHALEFQAAELKSYEKQISAETKFPNQNKVILWLGKTNDFGLNWVKPIGHILFITLFFYFLIILSASDKLVLLPARNSFENTQTAKVFKDYLFLLPELLNPTRTLNRILEPKTGVISFTFWVYFWDAFHKIILAFYIFQIISAFRKYIK